MIEYKEDFKHKYGNGVCLAPLKAKDFKFILSSYYGINDVTFHTNTKVDTPEKIFKIVHEILLKNGYTDPYRTFKAFSEIPKGSFGPFNKACEHDIITLAYMTQILITAKEHKYNDSHSFPISSGMRSYFKILDESPYAPLLGFRRRTPNISVSNQQNTWKELGIEKTLSNPRYLMSNDCDNDSFKYYSGTSKYPVNRACRFLFASLVICRDTDPFLLKNLAEKITENSHSAKNHKYLSLIEDDSSSFADAEFKDFFKKFFISTASLIEAYKTFQSTLNLHELETFYYKLNSDIKSRTIKYCTENNSSQKNKALTISTVEPDAYCYAQTNAYLIEAIYAFKFCEYFINKTNCNWGDNTLFTMHLLSEFPYCNSRTLYIDLYQKTFKQKYIYAGKVYNNFSYSNWHLHLKEHLLYTMGRYMPALYYTYMYVYLKTEKQPSEEFFKKYISTLDFENRYTVNKRLFSEDSTKRFYLLRKQHYLTELNLFHKFKPSKNHSKMKNYVLSQQLEKITRNIF